MENSVPYPKTCHTLYISPFLHHKKFTTQPYMYKKNSVLVLTEKTMNKCQKNKEFINFSPELV